MALNGVLIMLSFLANQQVNFKLPGVCPVPPKSTNIFNSEVPVRAGNYYTALHYNSEAEGSNIFGSSLYGVSPNELNCLRLSFENTNGSSMFLEDCGVYHGNMTMDVEKFNFNIALRLITKTSSCFNQTTKIENLSVWADENRDFIVFWSCTNGTKTNSTQKQLSVVYISQDYMDNHQMSKGVSLELLQAVTLFAKEKLYFTGLNVSDFDVNHRLLIEHNPECGLTNCSNDCTEVVEGSSFGAPIIFFIVICFVAIIIFVVLL